MVAVKNPVQARAHFIQVFFELELLQAGGVHLALHQPQEPQSREAALAPLQHHVILEDVEVVDHARLHVWQHLYPVFLVRGGDRRAHEPVVGGAILVGPQQESVCAVVVNVVAESSLPCLHHRDWASGPLGCV
jgi:hypothetical protein